MFEASDAGCVTDQDMQKTEDDIKSEQTQNVKSNENNHHSQLYSIDT